jgi:hypothetical protein
MVVGNTTANVACHAITNMTRQRHHATANIASVVPSLARLSSSITNMTRQRHHTTTNIASATPSPA